MSIYEACVPCVCKKRAGGGGKKEIRGGGTSVTVDKKRLTSFLQNRVLL